MELEGWTNDRLIAERAARLNRAEWVFGVPNASVVMASFLHGGLTGLRFTSADLNGWYASCARRTAIAEVAHHLRREAGNMRIPSLTLQYRTYSAKLIDAICIAFSLLDWICPVCAHICIDGASQAWALITSSTDAALSKVSPSRVAFTCGSACAAARRRRTPFTSRFAELWRTSLEATTVSCHPYPMSTSLQSDSDLEPIVFEWTPEQMQILVQTAAGVRCAPELEPLPIKVLTDPLPLPLHQAISPEGEETKALESDAAPLPTSQERSLGSNEQSRKPLRTGRVGLLVRVLLHVGLLVGITYVRQIGEEPIQVAQKVDPEPARVGEERAPTAPSVDSEAVRIKNPFDRTEAFEFPPGTSKAEAREAIAKLLLERAHDRLPLLAQASRRRGATAKHGTHESSEPQDSQYRNSQTVLGRGPG